MKLAVSRTLTSNVTGNQKQISIVPGTAIDLDDVVGVVEGKPLTLAGALGPDLVACCDLMAPPKAEKSRKADSGSAPAAQE